jgi:ribonuclease P protein component
MIQVTRLPKTSVVKIIKEGRVIHSPLFSIKFLPNNLTNSRFAVSVSKKEEKTAVLRNRIKRRSKEILRNLLKNKQKTYDIVCFAKKNIKDTPFLVLVDIFDSSTKSIIL